MNTRRKTFALFSSVSIPPVAMPTPTIPRKHRPTAIHSPSLSFSLNTKWLRRERKTSPPPETGWMIETGAFARAVTMKTDPDRSARSPEAHVRLTRYLRMVCMSAEN